MSQTQRIEKVAIVGATGRVGSHYASSLAATGKHTVTALSRADSKGSLPSGVHRVAVDYASEESVVSALRGQDLLIITLPVTGPRDASGKLVQAAAKAGVRHIIPNIHGLDIFNPALREDILTPPAILQVCEQIEGLGMSWTAMICGFWYEWSLALGEQWFGFSIRDKKVTFFDEGTTPVAASTWLQCGSAVAALLSLPESGAKPAVLDWKNKPLYFDSFRVTQRDILDSLHRVMGTTDKDWEIRYEPTQKRFKEGVEEMQSGQITGFAKALYSRSFYPNAGGDFETKGLANEVLGLPKESLDEATKRAVEMAERGWNPFAG